MSLTKIFTACAMTFVLLTYVSAQENTSKIVWSGLEKTYIDFKNIKPQIKLEGRDWIFWKMLPLYLLLYRYDDSRKNWVEGKTHLTDTYSMVTGPIVLRWGETIPDVFHAGQFFEWAKGEEYFFISQNRERFPVNGNYRITFFYGIDRDSPTKLDQFSHSPEFKIEGKYPVAK